MALTAGSLESLEPRRLFAGVTIIAHGLDGTIAGWVTDAAAEVANRAGGTSSAAVYTLTVGRSNGNIAVLSYTRDSGYSAPTSLGACEIVIKLDWSTVSDSSASTGDVAGVVASFIRSKPSGEVRLAELPIHLIGFSRGGSLVTAIARSLGRSGVWVDQQTNLDPHPIDGINEPRNENYGDTAMATFDNVAFSDTYWRSAGSPGDNGDYDGEAVSGSHNLNVTGVQQLNVNNAHQSVQTYYSGTIDLSATSAGGISINSGWYDSSPSKPARSATGFLFSRIVGGARPADGLWSAQGGSAARSAAGKSGSQWANVGDLKVMGGYTFSAGSTIQIRNIRQDRDTGATLSLFLDRDRNPYDGTTKTIRKASISAGDSIQSGRLSGSTSGVSAGRYFIGAKITDADGHTRYAYGKRITLTSGTRAVTHALSYVPATAPPTPVLWGQERIRLADEPSIVP